LVVDPAFFAVHGDKLSKVWEKVKTQL
jgi:hypothetical protein